MSQAKEQLEKQQSKLEKDNKRLNDTNEMLLEITKKQRLMVDTSDQSRGNMLCVFISSKSTTNLFVEFKRTVQTSIQAIILTNILHMLDISKVYLEFGRLNKNID